MNTPYAAEPETITRSVVPAFFVIDLPAGDADDVAADMCITVNSQLRAQARNAGHRIPRVRLMLCEASGTNEQEVSPGEPDPSTLEGLTCDSGSDRSATALIQRIVDTGLTMVPSKRDTHTEALSKILQMAVGWLQQRMVLRPNTLPHPAPSCPAPPIEQAQSSALQLMHAFARAYASHKTPAWPDLENALNQAKAENPGLFDTILDMHVAQHLKELGHANAG